MVLNLRPKCANPSCAASFEWLAGGRLFRFQRDAKAPAPAAYGNNHMASDFHATGHFWLCEKCSMVYTLQFEPGHGVVIRLLWPELPAAKEEMRLSAS
jgi:hypothetical protein